MASGSEQYAGVNIGRSSKASSRGGGMIDYGSRDRGGEVPF